MSIPPTRIAKLLRGHIVKDVLLIFGAQQGPDSHVTEHRAADSRRQLLRSSVASAAIGLKLTLSGPIYSRSFHGLLDCLLLLENRLPSLHLGNQAAE